MTIFRLIGLLIGIGLVTFVLWYWVSSPGMSLAQALAVAQQSECAQKGTLSGSGIYNANTSTWWLDFAPSSQYVQQGCSPSCVVFTASSTAEINWRCTGAISPATKDDLITVDSPLPNTVMQSPYIVSGKARGPWYFEAQFPIKIYDSNHKMLGSVGAQAQGNWMTTDYVPFSAALTFDTPTTATGTLVLEKDNPSGLPQNANQLEIPVAFSATTNTFNEEGNVTRNNPGQKPNVWYLVYENPGAPGISVELDLNSVSAPYIVLSQGERVRVEGVLRGSVVIAHSITPVADATSTLIKLYYYNPQLDQGLGGTQCSVNGLVAVYRIIPKTTTPLQDSIRLLLRGELSTEETSQGITTEFPLAGVSLKSATITNGIATLTFLDPQNKTSGGACRSGILWSEIEATAKQFSSVQSVRFMPLDLFQP